MRELDYRLVQALEAVVRERSFERAADKLCITQSAVSQRIKQLEKLLAQPLLVRSQPPCPTEAGQQLLGLYQRVCLLEQEVLPALQGETGTHHLELSVAVNADTLATWLIPALTPLLQEGRLILNLLLGDESRNLEKLRRGEVIAAVSTERTALPGCTADYLGSIDYLCVCTPEFARRYFPQGVTREALLHAPAVAFDQYDDMHQMFLQRHFELPGGSVPCHTVRSSEAFVALAQAGVAYCMIPHLQVSTALQRGELINITPELKDTRHLYWHRWALESGSLKAVSERVLAQARTQLLQYTDSHK